jgi:hypothetical protein
MYDTTTPYAYQDFPVTEDTMFILTDEELREIAALEDYIYDIAGDYPKFVTVNDAKNFAGALEYYVETEGYSPSHAYEAALKDMDL